jgi:hypothetical protein
LPGNYERSRVKVNLELAIKLFERFNVSIHWLLFDQGDMFNTIGNPDTNESVHLYSVKKGDDCEKRILELSTELRVYKEWFEKFTKKLT